MDASRRTMGSVIRQRRRAKKMSLEALATRAMCAKSYLSEIENERRSPPPGAPVLRRIEGALELDAGTLVDMAAWARTPGEVREHVQQLETRDRVARRLVDLVSNRLNGPRAGARIGRSLDAAYKSGELRKLIDVMAPADPGASADGRGAELRRDPSRDRLERVLPMQVPLINAVAAGYPAEFTDLGYPARVADEYVRSPELADPDAFAARVVGESMLPEYREGDIVIFSPARVVRSAMDCFVRLEPDQESTFKRIFFQTSAAISPPTERTTRERAEQRERSDEGDWIRLQPLNARYPVRVVHREQVAGMYAAVSVTRSLG